MSCCRSRHPGVSRLLLAALLAVAGATGARGEMQPAAVSLLERMYKTYASAPAFACDGSCDDHEDGSSLPADHRTVTIRFARPDRFRLAWTQKDFRGRSGTSVIFTRRGTIFFHQSGSGQSVPEPSVGQAAESSAGISLGLSFLIPALLFGDRGYLEFTALRQLPDARSDDGQACWKLAGETGQGARWELFIDQETCALRQAAEVNVLASAFESSDHPAAPTPASDAHAIRTLYRFTNIRFTGSWPAGAFAEHPSAGPKKH